MATDDSTGLGGKDPARTRLLGGRGPGADRREIAEHTRYRAAIGGIPVPQLLEATALEAAVTRGDVAALADRVAQQRSRVADDVTELRGRTSQTRPVGSWVAAFGMGLVVGWLLRSRRRGRSTGGPPATRPARAPGARRRRRTRST